MYKFYYIEFSKKESDLTKMRKNNFTKYSCKKQGCKIYQCLVQLLKLIPLVVFC